MSGGEAWDHAARRRRPPEAGRTVCRGARPERRELSRPALAAEAVPVEAEAGPPVAGASARLQPAEAVQPMAGGAAWLVAAGAERAAVGGRVVLRWAVVGLLALAPGCRKEPLPVEPKVEADGHYVAATAAYLKGDFKEAHAQFDEVRRLNPKDPRLPGAEGELLLAEQRIDEALQRFEAAVALDPGRATTWSRLGVLYGIKRNDAKAKAALEKALSLNPKDVTAHEALGDAALEAGQLDEAVRRYLLASDAAPDKARAELVVKAAGELVKAKQGARALEVLEAARGKGVASPALSQELGDRYIEASRWDDAIAAYTVAAAADPSAWELVAELELREGRLEKAELAWRNAIAAKDQALFHVGLGRVCLARKDQACAQAELDKALSTATGEEVRESMELAEFLSHLGRRADALRLLEAVAAEEDQAKNEALQFATARLARALGKSDVVRAACARIAPVKCPE
ncbi:MAG: tetratricopeptide repeat protein [Myxococcaceae bacterium]|nr:tetratricopeptide repeat protein [Myxococcaceae bacterium]